MYREVWAGHSEGGILGENEKINNKNLKYRIVYLWIVVGETDVESTKQTKMEVFNQVWKMTDKLKRMVVVSEAKNRVGNG